MGRIQYFLDIFIKASPRVGAWVDLVPGHGWAGGQAADVELRLGVGDEGDVGLGGAAQHLLDLADLLQVDIV